MTDISEFVEITIDMDRKPTAMYSAVNWVNTLPPNYDKYPHVCPICDKPAYIGGDNSIDCSSCDGKYK